MADKHDSPGGDMIDRVSSRLDTDQLRRTSMPGGGEIFRGELATRALDAVGARAMTLDRTIIVNDDFDPSNPEDQALFAHEQYHAEEGDGGGGGGGDNFRDVEEVAARAVERMALHRAMSGGYEAGYSDGAGPGQGDAMTGTAGGSVGAGSGEAARKGADGTEDPSADRGYQALVSQGYKHDDIVDELTQRIVRTLDERQQVKQDRHGDKKGFI